MQDIDALRFSTKDVIDALQACGASIGLAGDAWDLAAQLTGLSVNKLCQLVDATQELDGPVELQVGMVGNIRAMPGVKKELRGKAFEIVDFSPGVSYPILKVEGMDGTYSALEGHLENVRMPEIGRGNDGDALLKEAGIDVIVGVGENDALFIGHDVKVFLDGAGAMCCRLPDEDDVRPLKFSAQEIKEGDAFLFGNIGAVRTTSDDACYDPWNDGWFVHGDDGEVYLEGDIGKDLGEKLKGVLEKMHAPLKATLDNAYEQAGGGESRREEIECVME